MDTHIVRFIIDAVGKLDISIFKVKQRGRAPEMMLAGM
jgi:hypothetical protein